MQLRLLGAVLYYLGPTGRQGTVDLGPCLASHKARARQASTCYTTVPMGINAVDLRVSPDIDFADATAKFAKDEEIVCAGCGTEQTVLTTAFSHRCQTCTARTRPADADAVGSQRWMLGPQVGVWGGTRTNQVAFRDHFISPLMAHTVDLIWFGAGTDATECSGEDAEMKRCRVELRLRLQQCVYLQDLQGRGENAWVFTGAASSGEDVSVPMVWVGQREGFANSAAELAKPATSAPENAERLFDGDFRAAAEATARGALGAGATAKAVTAAATEALRERWSAMDGAARKPYGDRRYALKVAQETERAGHEQMVSLRDHHTLLHAGSTGAQAQAFVQARPLLDACWQKGAKFVDTFSRDWHGAAMVVAGVSTLELCTRGADSVLGWLSKLVYSPIEVQCAPETWVSIDLAKLRLARTRSKCGDFSALDAAQLEGGAWWLPHVGCLDHGCVFEQQRLALESCSPGADCDRSRYLAACMSRECSSNLFGLGWRAVKKAKGYAAGHAVRTYARTGSELQPAPDGAAPLGKRWLDSKPRGAGGLAGPPPQSGP
jgi:hypothetical protein